MGLPLAGRSAIVIGVERAQGRRAAVALAEAGADVGVLTLSEDTPAEFAANSTGNEFWAICRKGVALATDGTDRALGEAIAAVTSELGQISIVIWHKPARGSMDVFTGLRSDPAVVVLVAAEDALDASLDLLAWTRDIAEAGMRANAVVEPALADAARQCLQEHHAPRDMDAAAAVVYLASDASAAIEGAVVIAAG
jgi:NAD(P)-dependent dehydrogenase (short-subunit alcohol dehydrogenase family)